MSFLIIASSYSITKILWSLIQLLLYLNQQAALAIYKGFLFLIHSAKKFGIDMYLKI
jgi:hypothetical protein